MRRCVERIVNTIAVDTTVFSFLEPFCVRAVEIPSVILGLITCECREALLVEEGLETAKKRRKTTTYATIDLLLLLLLHLTKQ